MSRAGPPLSPEVEALLDRERVVPPVPSHVRTRALARARAALIAGRITAPQDPRGASRARWGVATAIACAASVAAAATAYEIGSHRRPAGDNSLPAPGAHVDTAPVAPMLPTPATPPTPPAPAAAMNDAPAPSLAAPTSPSRSRPNEPGPEELRLLRRARAAVARQDFTGALGPIGEHARRFKDGRLTEEREALRVKALAGLGRTEEARHAANAFEARFPRSVLAPAVSHMATGGQ